MANSNEIYQLFEVLWANELEIPEWPQQTPFLAHYTSMEVLEQILKTETMWFSNPLFMNDFEEVRFGVIHGVRIVRESNALSTALGTDERRVIFRDAIDHYLSEFDDEHVFDTYIFCLTAQDPNDHDGLLSMWRGYGGNGKGAAIVFDTSKIGPEIQSSALILAKVHYGSSDERFAWLDKAATTVAEIISHNDIPNDKLYLSAHAIFNRIKLFALFTKHHGFAEENEWRVAYLPDRDPDGKLKPMFGYLNGPRGVEPKLKFKVETVDGVTAPGLNLNNIVHSILLGPTAASPLAHRSVLRMLEMIGKPEYTSRVFASTIPFRTSVMPP